MDDIFVARLMTTNLQTVTPDTLVEEAAAEMLNTDVSSLVVVDETDHLAGILTTTDFVEIVAKSEPKAQTPVSQYMSTDVETTTAQESIRDAADRMIERGVHHVPVVDDDAGVIGMLSTTDLTSYVSSVEASPPT